MQYAGLFPFFTELSHQGRQEFGALPSTRTAPHQSLLRRGDLTSGAFFVLEGLLRVFYITSEGRQATLYRVEAGGTCILALGSTFLSQPYPAWVEAGAEGSHWLRIPSETFHKLMRSETAFSSFVFEAMSGRIFELMRTLEEVTTSTVTQRVAAFLLGAVAHDGEVVVTQSQLALEVGTAREVVFRALQGLAKRGLIETRRGRVRVLDAERLADE